MFHLLSGLVAVVCAWKSHTFSVNYLKYAGIPYALDVVTGILFGRNLPHIVIPVSMMAIGFVLARLKLARAKAG